MAVSSPDLKAFLLETPFFGGLSDASLDLLVSMLVERRFDAGATVVAEGEPGRSMFIVHSGELAVSKLTDSGRVIRMRDLEPGDFFGEMTLIEMQNRSATVISREPNRAVRTHRPKTLRVLQGRYPCLCDYDAEYQPRALPAASPRRQSHCRTADVSRGGMTPTGDASFALRRNNIAAMSVSIWSLASRDAAILSENANMRHRTDRAIDRSINWMGRKPATHGTHAATFRDSMPVTPGGTYGR